MLVTSLREPRWLLNIHLRGSGTEFQPLEFHIKFTDIIYNRKQKWVFFLFHFLTLWFIFPISRLCASLISCTTPWPPPGQNSSQGKQLMVVAHQLLRVTCEVKRRASWGKRCFNTVLHLDLKYMPLLSHLQKALIYLKNSQWALGVERPYREIPGCPFQLPFLPVVWVGQDVAEVQHTSDQFSHL